MASGNRIAKPTAVLPHGSDAESLFVTHGNWLLGSLRQRYGPDVAEDLPQETYLRILRQTEAVEIRHPRAFLLRVARNLFLGHYRQSARRSELDRVHQRTQTGIEAAGQVETVLIKQIILGMPIRLRDVLVLSRVAGMSHEAIAEHLGIKRKTVESRMTEALAYCAAQLRE